MTPFLTDLLLYLVQAIAMTAVVLFIELVLKRAPLSDSNSIWAVTWAVAQVGLLALARLHLFPLEGTAQDGAIHCWVIVFWSFVAAFIPVAAWTWISDQQQTRELLERRYGKTK